MIFAHPARRLRLHAAACVLAIAAAALVPRPARAYRLLDEELTLAGPAAAGRPDLSVAVALFAKAPPGSMDFDLLPEAKAPPPNPDDARMKQRHRLLQLHQRVGLAILGLETATVLVGQLNYNDKFGTSNTGRYVLSHQVLAYSTFGAFALGGTLALLAPRPPGKPNRGWDRVRVHKIGMLLATAGMVAQAVVGIHTRQREGYLDQEQIGKTHLAIGYATLAATGVAVGALVF